MKKELAIYDPLGNQVFVPVSFFEKEPTLQEAQITSAIRRPAMHLVAKDHSEQYYFRSVDWYQTILITTRQNNKGWEVTAIAHNPSKELLASLMKKSNQLS